MGRVRVYARIARVLLVVALGLSMASVFGVFERLGVANSWCAVSVGRGSLCRG